MSTMYHRILNFIRNSPAIVLLIMLMLLFNSLASVLEMGSIADQFGGKISSHQWFWLVLSIFMSPNNPVLAAITIGAVFLLGPTLEKIYGSTKLTLIFLCCGILGGFSFLYLSDYGFVYCSILSVYGLVGVYAGLFLKRTRMIYNSIKLSFLVFLMILLVYTFIQSTQPFEIIVIGMIPGVIFPLVIRPQPFKKFLKINVGNAFLKSFFAVAIVFFILFIPKMIQLASEANLIMDDLNLQNSVFD